MEKGTEAKAQREEPVMADELVVKVKLTEPNKVKIDFREPDKVTQALSQVAGT